MRKIALRVLFIVPLLLVGAVAWSGQTPTPDQEADAHFAKANANLNASYDKLLAKLDDEGKAKLREAQQAWIRFRDADSESARNLRGSSMGHTVRTAHEIELTEARTRELNARLQEIQETARR